jgi:hypothetical protein
MKTGLRHSDERKRRINVERREKYAKRRSEEEKQMIKLTKNDSDDLKQVGSGKKFCRGGTYIW